MASEPEAEAVDWQSIKSLVFGGGVKQTVLDRWLQPFTFSSQEPAALVQGAGGPCAVIAPLQAFLLKASLEKGISSLSNLGKETVRGLMVHAMVEVLSKCKTTDSAPLVLARVTPEIAEAMSEQQDDHQAKRARHEVSADVDTLHTILSVERHHDVVSLTTRLEENWEELFGTQYDIIAFLYSVVLTKGPQNVITERGDADESLIDPIHGHGSQSLINLLLTGNATQNVFDGTKDLCGLQLQGIEKQASVGFLSYLECLRYLEVGNHLKCPSWPVWVLGSETHLTVLFSRQLSLVAPPSPREAAVSAFTALDTDQSGFIPGTSLATLMQNLGLFAEEEYVELMRSKMDSEGLGIILVHQFLEEFYPDSALTSCPDSFTLHHYNGLVRGEGAVVKFRHGEAVRLEGVSGSAEGNPLLQTLQTKWKNLAVDWDGSLPSII